MFRCFGAGMRPDIGLGLTHVLNPSSVGLSLIRRDWRGPKIVAQKHMIRTWKIRVGDYVKVCSGKDKEKEGEVIQTDVRRNMVRVRGCNLRRMKDPEGNHYMVEKKIHYSNVNLIDPHTGTPTRVALKYTDDGGLIRISKKSGSILHWPYKKDKVEKIIVEGPKDTSVEKALEKTYDYHADQEAIVLARAAMTKYNYDLH